MDKCTNADNDACCCSASSLSQQHQDELASLEAMYTDGDDGDDVSLFVESGNSVLISVWPQRLPSPLSLSSNLSVNFLPCIQCPVELIPTYPASTPPIFNIFCDWLDDDAIEEIRGAMLRMYDDGGGEAVLFKWIDLLRNDLFTVIDVNHIIQNIFNTGNANANAKGKENESGDARDIDDLLMLLYDADQQRTMREKSRTVCKCVVCLDSKPGNEFVDMPCNHSMCFGCATELCMAAIKLKAIESLKCPVRDCNCDIPPSVLIRVVDDVSYARYLEISLEKACSKSKDLQFCPRPWCASVSTVEGDKLCVCGSCGYSFCCRCGQSYHGDTPCKDEIEHSEEEEEDDGDAHAHWPAQALPPASAPDWDTSLVKLCPQCAAVIEKNGGCNNMYCFNCRSGFNWMDAIPISAGGTVRRHVQIRSVKLFKIERERVGKHHQAMWQEKHSSVKTSWVTLQDDIKSFRNYVLKSTGDTYISGRPCPGCKMFFVKKDHNNHVSCPVCLLKFCLVCGLPATATSHFGPTSCTQHTPPSPAIQDPEAKKLLNSIGETLESYRTNIGYLPSSASDPGTKVDMMLRNAKPAYK